MSDGKERGTLKPALLLGLAFGMIWWSWVIVCDQLGGSKPKGGRSAPDDEGKEDKHWWIHLATMSVNVACAQNATVATLGALGESHWLQEYNLFFKVTSVQH